MKITVKLFATFRNSRFKSKEMEVSEPKVLGGLLEDINIPKEEIGILLVNGKNVATDYTLKDEDTVSIFPALGGG